MADKMTDSEKLMYGIMGAIAYGNVTLRRTKNRGIYS